MSVDSRYHVKTARKIYKTLKLDFYYFFWGGGGGGLILSGQKKKDLAVLLYQ